LTISERRELLHRIIESGLQIAPDALNFIMDQDSPSTLVDIIISDSYTTEYPIITLDILHSILDSTYYEESSVQEQLEDTDDDNHDIVREPAIETGIVEEGKWDILIQKTPEFNLVGSEGTVDDFLALFRDRYARIRQIYQSRIDTANALSPAAAKLRVVDGRRRRAMSREGIRTERAPTQVVLGMVKSKNVSRSGNIIIELEDSEDTLTCIIPGNMSGPDGKTLSEKGGSILIDEVICMSGYVEYVNQIQRMIVRDIIFPDIPTARNLGRANRNLYAVFISDLHVGSKEFLEDEFNTFLNWLRGVDVDSDLKEVVNSTRYLFIAGDLIDGIGVYPDQKADLLLPDIYDQYKALSKFLKKIPNGIKIICIPGNHDACRQALPKPPIPEEFARPLYDLGDRIIMLGDPSQIRVDGVSVLLTHGDSQDDLVTSIPGVSYREPAASMRELLKKRHLAPIYGNKTELAPLRTDWMVIDQVPDIVHFGHAHHNAVDLYRGVLMINSGTFQSQTEFMKKQGIDPTPGIVTYVNLASGEPGVKPFYYFPE